MKRDETRRGDVLSDGFCWFVAGAILVGFLVLALRLHNVQVSNTASYDYANDRQSVRRVQTDGLRGRILDRNGAVLADNRSRLQIVCRPENFQRRDPAKTAKAVREAMERLGGVLGRAVVPTEREILRHIRTDALPMVVWSTVSERDVAILSERAEEFPGFEVSESVERAYPYGPLAAHLVGYVGRDRGEAVAGDEKFNFFLPEMRGRSGLEIYYDSFLRGVSGEKRVLVDARGFAIREWTVVAPSRGPDLRLTLDVELQKVAERELAGLRGACVAIDPRNGDVLVFASAPGYDPNDFIPVLRPDLYERYAKDPAKPLLNRASGGAYAPGSTFKPITALAGLSLGYPHRLAYECLGVFEYGTMRLKCSSRWGHGPLDMRHALMKSCNSYFCNMAMDVGTNAIIRTARAFGLGSKTGLDLGVDMAGTVPEATWKMRMYGEKWYAADLAQMAIGQGMLLVSPLQMARVAGALGTGRLVTPRLKADLPVESRVVPIPTNDLAIVRAGMRMVVAGDPEKPGERGTGWRAGVDVPVAVSGKTGTAEVGVGERRRKNVWFIAFAPSENPTFALAIVVENGESGGLTAAPKAAALFRAAARYGVVKAPPAPEDR